MKTELLSFTVDWRRPVLVSTKISRYHLLENRTIWKDGWGQESHTTSRTKLTQINVYHGDLRTESVQNTNMSN